MRQVGLPALLLPASLCSAQERSDFRPATTNVWGAEYPRVDSTGRVEIRFKAPDATKVRANFWSGPKVDMARQPDGFWTVVTPPLAPGLHYYMLIVDGAEVADTGSHSFFGGGKHASAVEVPEGGVDYYAIRPVPHGQVREVWYDSNVTGTWRHALVYTPPGYDLQPTDEGGCCVVTSVNLRDDAATVVCFVYVLDDAGRLLATRVVPPLPPGHRRSSGFSAPPGRFEQGVYEIPLQLPEQRYRTTCRPAAWHGGAPI